MAERFMKSFWSGGSPNRLGSANKEELEIAIENCKDMILQTPNQSTDKKRQLVKELVELRRQLHELKEGVVEEVDSFNICGHKFVSQGRKTSGNRFCDKCAQLVWGLVQPWFKCQSCGFYCHAKCLNVVNRLCASVKAYDNPIYVLDICPERGLAAQKYRCAECRTKLCVEADRQQLPVGRLCDYTGQYFCPTCHWNDEMPIPARIVNNWDFDPQPVSRNSRQFLKVMQKKPVLRFEDLNPQLFSYIQEIRSIKVTEIISVVKDEQALRSDLLLMKPFLLCCREAAKLRLFAQLKPYGHFMDSLDGYCIQDLIDLQTGALENRLKSVIDSYSKHIKHDCQTCRGNGFVCELCDDQEILFPFEDYVSTCRQCCAVFHRLCFEKNHLKCPRCQRRTRRESENVFSVENNPHDF